MPHVPKNPIKVTTFLGALDKIPVEEWEADLSIEETKKFLFLQDKISKDPDIALGAAMIARALDMAESDGFITEGTEEEGQKQMGLLWAAMEARMQIAQGIREGSLKQFTNDDGVVCVAPIHYEGKNLQGRDPKIH